MRDFIYNYARMVLANGYTYEETAKDLDLPVSYIKNLVKTEAIRRKTGYYNYLKDPLYISLLKQMDSHAYAKRLYNILLKHNIKDLDTLAKMDKERLGKLEKIGSTYLNVLERIKEEYMCHNNSNLK